MLTAGLKTLEYVLEATPQILRSRDIVPGGEHDVQRALHDHLESAFPDYDKNIKLPKGLKSFVPDGGVCSLGAAIEIKFADSMERVKTALSGVMEDLSGYAGSRDYTRFYSLVYQTAPFVAETLFKQSLQRSGNAGNWKVIVVNDRGGRGIGGGAA